MRIITILITTWTRLVSNHNNNWVVSPKTICTDGVADTDKCKDHYLSTTTKYRWNQGLSINRYQEIRALFIFWLSFVGDFHPLTQFKQQLLWTFLQIFKMMRRLILPITNSQSVVPVIIEPTPPINPIYQNSQVCRMSGRPGPCLGSMVSKVKVIKTITNIINHHQD